MTNGSNGKDAPPVIFIRKIILVYCIKLKHFKAIVLNDNLISKACKDFGGENDAILKRKKVDIDP